MAIDRAEPAAPAPASWIWHSVDRIEASSFIEDEAVDLLEFQISIQLSPVDVPEYAEHSVIRALVLPKVPVRLGCTDAQSKDALLSVEQSEEMSVLLPALERR